MRGGTRTVSQVDKRMKWAPGGSSSELERSLETGRSFDLRQGPARRASDEVGMAGLTLVLAQVTRVSC